jgi:hypothetical protein
MIYLYATLFFGMCQALYYSIVKSRISECSVPFFLCLRLKFMNKETQKTYKVCCADFAIVIYKQLLPHSEELCPCSLLNTAVLTRMAKWRLAPRILNFATKWQWVLILAPWSLYPRYLLHMKLGGPQNRPAPSVGGGGGALLLCRFNDDYSIYRSVD